MLSDSAVDPGEPPFRSPRVRCWNEGAIIAAAAPLASPPLPDADAPARKVHATGPPAVSPEQAPVRILLVEDDAMIRQIGQRMLQRAGCEVDAVQDGHAAWESLQTQRYDLLITDNRMPGLSGTELVRRLRAAQVKTPVLFASGALDGEETGRNESLEPVASLPKPFTSEELLTAVARMLPAALRVQYEAATTFAVPIERYDHWGLNE